MEAMTVSGLSKSYKDVFALKDVNLRIEAGEKFGLFGPNGVRL